LPLPARAESAGGRRRPVGVVHSGACGAAPRRGHAACGQSRPKGRPTADKTARAHVAVSPLRLPTVPPRVTRPLATAGDARGASRTVAWPHAAGG